MTVANCITMTRLLLSPVFVYFFIIGDRHTAFVVFCVAGGTDLIDGMVARLLKQRSRYGAILDPIADKVLLESAFICLVIGGVLPLWFLLLALARDLMIVGGLIFFKLKKWEVAIRVYWSSKFATLFQLTTIISALLLWWKSGISLFGIPFSQLIFVFMIIAAILIVVSGVQYFMMGLNQLKLFRQKLQ
jgi:cardiolipin synthase